MEQVNIATRLSDPPTTTNQQHSIPSISSAPSTDVTTSTGVHHDVITIDDNNASNTNNNNNNTDNKTAHKNNDMDETQNELPSREFGVQVFNVPKWIDHKEMMKMLTDLQIPHMDVMKRKGNLFCFVIFKDEAQKLASSELLRNVADSKGKKIYKVKELKFSFEEKERRKRKNKKKDKNDEPAQKKLKIDNTNSNNNNNNNDSKENNTNIDEDTEEKKPAKTVAEIVSPLAHLPYEAQLNKKSRKMQSLLKTAAHQMHKQFPQTSLPHVTSNKLICPLDPIVPSPTIDGYRNKCEFTIGKNKAGELCTGFLLNSYIKDNNLVEAPTDCRNVAEVAKSSALIFTEYIKTKPYEVYEKTAHVGVWRLLVVRNSQKTGQLMVTAQIDPSTLTPEQVEEVKKELVLHFSKHMIEDTNWSTQYKHTLTSLQIQLYSGISNAAPEDCPVECLYGATYITDQLYDLTFRISHHAFFQVNTLGAEKLYGLAAEWGRCTHNTTLFDICCGTGTIGLTMASKVGKVIGLELVSSAIEDAKQNAQRNNIENATYICGKAEDTLDAALKEHAISDDIVAIVDPPRGGLHPSVVKLMRSCVKLKRVVYVSCNPKTLVDNLIKFIQPPTKKWKGSPFTAIRAVPVDMFPHTEHCEMIMLLERS